MKKHITTIKFFYIFCLIQDDMLTFFSGVFVSVALNILTSRLPDSILVLSTTQLILIALMLIASFLFIRWAILIKPIQANFSSQEIARKALGDSMCWDNLLDEYSVKRKLVLYLILEILLSVICFILLLYPDILVNICKWFSALISESNILS